MPVTVDRPCLAEHKKVQAELTAVIVAAEQRNPRSLQTVIGPSEIGHPCARRLAYHMWDYPRSPEHHGDPWAAISGTAIHAWLAAAFASAPDDDWLVEVPVAVTDGITGSADLYSPSRALVVDHKCCGEASHRNYKGNGPSSQQLDQVMLYGFGLRRLGLPVARVALAYYRLGGLLGNLHVWVGEFDQERAVAALSRLENVVTVGLQLDLDAHPERIGMVPARPARSCRWCPWFAYRSADVAQACPGDTMASSPSVGEDSIPIPVGAYAQDGD